MSAKMVVGLSHYLTPCSRTHAGVRSHALKALCLHLLDNKFHCPLSVETALCHILH